MNIMALALAVFLVALAIPVLLRRPNYAVSLLTFVIATNLIFVLSQRFHIPEVEKMVLAAGIGLILSYRILYRHELGGSTRFYFAVALWLASTLNSLLWSTSEAASIGSIRAYLPNILLTGTLFLLVDNRAKLYSALAGVGAGCVFLSSVTVMQFVFGFEAFDFYGFGNGGLDHIAGDIDAFRPTGSILDPNYYAQMLIPGFAILLGATIAAGTQKRRVLFGICALLIGVAIILTASRGGLLAVAILLVFWIVREKRSSLLLLMVPPVLITMLAVPSYSERVISASSAAVAAISGERINDASFAGRLAEMETAIVLFGQSPINGVGYGTFESNYQEISARNDLKLRSADRAAHSLYLETAAEQGIVGLCALFIIIVLTFTACARSRSIALAEDNRHLRAMVDALMAAGVGIFASAFFLHDAYGLSLWLMIALLFASERALISKRRQSVFLPVGVPIHGG